MKLDLFDEAVKEGPFHVLFVCTGNICRSPLAESLLRKLLYGLPVVVRSAGTHALVGAPMPEPNQLIAAEHGVQDAVDHTGRQLTGDDLQEADLVLALDRGHRREIVELLPRASRKTFTLREFARLVNALPEEQYLQHADAGARMRAAVASVAQQRGTLAPADDPTDEDVIDPYRQTNDVYTQSADQLIPAVDTVAMLLRRLAKGGE